MKTSYFSAAVFALAAAGLSVQAARADETTVIREQHTVTPQPAQTSELQHTTQTRTVEQHTTVAVAPPARKHYVVHRAPIQHRARAAVVHTRWRAPGHAVSSAAVNTSTTVQDSSKRTQVETASPTVIDRKTVIHRDDDGNVDRHTRVIKQDENGVTIVEHHASDPASDSDHH